MMREIENKAGEVFVWIGPASDDSDVVIEKFVSIGQKSIEAEIEDFRAADMATWLEPGGDERVRLIIAQLNELPTEEESVLFYQSIIPFL